MTLIRSKQKNSKLLPPTQNGVVLQTLALFIALLSFFIMLNSISSFEENKADSVLQSLENTFTSRALRQDIAPSMRENADGSIGEGAGLQDIDALFQARFEEVVKTEYDDKKGFFYAILPYKNLVESLENVAPFALSTLGSADSFSNLLKSFLNNKKNPFTLELYITSTAAFDTMFEKNENGEILIETQQKNASSLAEILDRMQFPQSKIRIGLSEGQNDNVLLIMRPDININPIRKPIAE